ncbi:hypothetical protein GQ600_24485 [Phytophthora cactorum]|nr:hypothetical protein GQ600_24485 [Phytophthora cactorum]
MTTGTNAVNVLYRSVVECPSQYLRLGLGKAVKGRSKDGKGKKDGGRETTEEERRLQESIRRMEMNDYLKRLTVSKKALLQEFMAKEEKISRMNKLKIQNHWRKIMRLVKVEALRKEVEVRSQNHERDVDRKDALIQMLDRDLEEAEEQFQMALRAHLLNVDELIDLQDEQLEQEFQTEKNKLITQHTMERNELQRIMQAVDQQEKEREADAKQEHEQLREEIRNKNLEDINVLRITLDSSIEELEQHFETAHLNYLQNTDQHQDLSRDIELKIRKIERLQQSLALWRTKIAQNVRECSERNKALEEEKAAISHHFQTLKAKMNRMREDQRRRLTDLSQGAREATKKLDAHLQLSERILQLGELVRKLETERERVLPFYHSTLADEHEANELTETVRLAMRTETGREDEDAQQMLDFQSQGLHSGVPVSEWEYLDLFWMRHNKVLLDELALRREKERVANENRELQTILQQYLAGISVSPTVLDGANPLLVINGRLRLHQPAISEDGRPRPKPVIDANHMVDTNRTNSPEAITRSDSLRGNVMRLECPRELDDKDWDGPIYAQLIKARRLRSGIYDGTSSPSKSGGARNESSSPDVTAARLAAVSELSVSFEDEEEHGPDAQDDYDDYEDKTPAPEPGAATPETARYHPDYDDFNDGTEGSKPSVASAKRSALLNAPRPPINGDTPAAKRVFDPNSQEKGRWPALANELQYPVNSVSTSQVAEDSVSLLLALGLEPHEAGAALQKWKKKLRKAFGAIGITKRKQPVSRWRPEEDPSKVPLPRHPRGSSVLLRLSVEPTDAFGTADASPYSKTRTW